MTDSKMLKFGFALKNWPKNMYHINILKNYQLPDLIHDHVDLDVHLDPQDGLKFLRIHKIQIPHKNLDYLHVHCPSITRIEDKLFLAGDHEVPNDQVLLPPGDDF